MKCRVGALCLAVFTVLGCTSTGESSYDTTSNASDSSSSARPAPAGDASDTPSVGAWFQLSTDDSTSMASPELYKSGQKSDLQAHEFVNYYDPPQALFASEPWGRTAEVTTGIELGLSGFTDTEDATRLHVLFQMRADSVSRDTRRNWNVVYCVDTSGSMSGDDKIGFVRQALTTSLGHFREGDQLSLVTFSTDARTIFVALDPVGNRDAIVDAFDALEPEESTNMIDGLKLAYELAENHFDTSALNRVVLFGDGDANVGDTDIETFASLTRIQNSEGIYLSSIGVGYNFAWDRMDRLADAGKGASIFLPNSSEVDLMFGDYFPKLIEVAADNVSIELTLPSGTTLEGFSGEESSTDQEQRVANIVLAAGDDITFVATFKLQAAEVVSQAARLDVSLRPLSTAETQTTSIELTQLSDLFTTPGRLYERTTIVNHFGQVASGDDDDIEALRASLDAYADSDAGLTEIRAIVDNLYGDVVD